MKSMWMVPAFIVIAFLFCSCSRQLAPYGHYQDSPVVADGNTDDWNLPLRFSNPEHSFQYTVTNDKKNLYICILSKDQGTQLRMLRSGIEIFFDPKGEKNRNISLEFPLKKTEQIPYNYNNPISASSTKMTMDQLILQSDYYNTRGFANIENGQFGLSDKRSDIKVALKLHDDSTLVYEAIVPLNDIPGVDLFGKKAGKNFSVSIVVKSAMTRSNPANNYSRQPSYGMRGMRMGGMGGGNRYNNNAQNQQPREEANWYQFRLAPGNAPNNK